MCALPGFAKKLKYPDKDVNRRYYVGYVVI